MDLPNKELFKNTNWIVALRYSEEQLIEIAKFCEYRATVVNTKIPADALRVVLDDYTVYKDFSMVLLVDGSLLNEKKFAAFLKKLEAVDTYCKIWFYNASLNYYPVTVLSRCSVFPNPTIKTHDDVIQEEDLALAGDLAFLRYYSYKFAVRMLRAKQSFVSFLLGLQKVSYRDYHLLTVHEKDADVFLYLFYEWLNYNGIFSKKETAYCPALRDYAFVKMLQMMSHDRSVEKYIIPFLIGYQATK